MIFSDVGPGCRWIGNEQGRANYPCWATYTPTSKDGNPGPGNVDYRKGMIGTVDGKFWIPGECDVSIRPGWFWHENQNNKVRSPRSILELYFASVGRGASFLLTVPPDRRGRIHENDVISLRGFKKALDRMFAENFAAGATASASASRGAGFEPALVLDYSKDTYWATPDGITTGTLEVVLPEPRTFSVIRLREAIRLGQRVRKFAVDVRKDGVVSEWQPDGSSIGAHVLLRGKPVTADALRVRITESAACPCIGEL